MHRYRELIAETGRLLLEKGLVARTWGNISVKCDDRHFAISPSGLGYENMTGEDVPVYDLVNDTWEGSRKPSSEVKVHTVSYRERPDVRFVLHTHQDYATAVGLAGTGDLELTPDEEKVLGRVIVAKYALPGTDELGANVGEAIKQGSEVILMKHHGVLILGNDRDDAMDKAEMLERVCKRAVDKKLDAGPALTASETIDEALLKSSENMIFFTGRDVLKAAELGGFDAQTDDMAQMLGERIDCVRNDNDAIMQALSKADAVLIKNAGCIVRTKESDDAQALKLLIKKAATAKAYTFACGVDADLTKEDCLKMRDIYINHYSKQK